MNNFIYFFMLFCIVYLLTSCEQEKITYMDVYNEEKIAIDKFVEEQGIKIIDKYPDDGVFKDKEYVLLDNGVYLHVIDLGNETRPVLGDDILSIAKGQILEKDTIIMFNGFQPNGDWAKWPLKFEYGNTHITFQDDYFLGEGYVNVMKSLGDSSSVSMIVPFAVGGPYQLSKYAPIYYEKVNFYLEK